MGAFLLKQPPKIKSWKAPCNQIANSIETALSIQQDPLGGVQLEVRVTKTLKTPRITRISRILNNQSIQQLKCRTLKASIAA
jgi:hypothetical protein